MCCMPIKIDQENNLIPHSCFVKLQAIYDSLKSAEKKAADLLLAEPGFFARASIVEAAEKAGCSEATLFRLARKMGYKGFPELKEDLTGKQDDDITHLYTNIKDGDDPDTVITKVFQASIQALNDTLNVIDRKEYQKAINAILQAKKMVIGGAGDAAAVAQSGYQKFVRLGIDVQFAADIDTQLINVSRLTQGDVLLAISHTGRTKSIVEIAKFARLNRATVISITNYPVSSLAKNSDIVLLTAAFTQHINGEVMSKRIAELCVLESLFVNVLLKSPSQMIANLDRSNRAVEINKI